MTVLKQIFINITEMGNNESKCNNEINSAVSVAYAEFHA